jgi:rhodanese-related sulfurtransferase
MAGSLYDSLQGKILKLPDETLVYPGHGAGSACGKNLSTATVSTIGEQRRLNYALQPMSREQFIGEVTACQPRPPAYFGHAVRFNRTDHETLDQVLTRSLRPLGPDALLEHRDAGAEILDTRVPDAFARSHLRGSINIGLNGRFASWAGAVLAADRPIVVIAEPGTEEEAALRLARIGFDRVAGFLDGGPQALGGLDGELQSMPRVSAPELHDELGSSRPPRLLDVRNPGEREQSRIDAPRGGLHIPLGELGARLEEVPLDGRWVIYCAGGYRSMIAASLLSRQAHRQIADLVGGICAWNELEFPGGRSA